MNTKGKTSTYNSTQSLSSRIGFNSSFETDTFLTFTIEIHTKKFPRQHGKSKKR